LVVLLEVPEAKSCFSISKTDMPREARVLSNAAADNATTDYNQVKLCETGKLKRLTTCFM